MNSLELNDPIEIEAFLSKVSLSGLGFNTDCLLMDVYDAGLDYPEGQVVGGDVEPKQWATSEEYRPYLDLLKRGSR